MSTNDSPSENCIAPEDTPDTPGKFGEPTTRTELGATEKLWAPRHSVRGTDARACAHHWDTESNLLHVVHPEAGRVHVADLQGHDIQDWEQHIADTRGWA